MFISSAVECKPLDQCSDPGFVEEKTGKVNESYVILNFKPAVSCDHHNSVYSFSVYAIAYDVQVSYRAYFPLPNVA